MRATMITEPRLNGYNVASRFWGRTWRRSSILDLLLVWSLRARTAAGGAAQLVVGTKPRFARSGLLATAHPERNPIVVEQVERRLAVTMIQSHRTPSNDHFVHVFVRNVGSATVNFYSLWLTVINP